jgi:hypothetical protein
MEVETENNAKNDTFLTVKNIKRTIMSSVRYYRMDDLEGLTALPQGQLQRAVYQFGALGIQTRLIDKRSAEYAQICRELGENPPKFPLISETEKKSENGTIIRTFTFVFCKPTPGPEVESNARLNWQVNKVADQWVTLMTALYRVGYVITPSVKKTRELLQRRSRDGTTMLDEENTLLGVWKKTDVDENYSASYLIINTQRRDLYVIFNDWEMAMDAEEVESDSQLFYTTKSGSWPFERIAARLMVSNSQPFYPTVFIAKSGVSMLNESELAEKKRREAQREEERKKVEKERKEKQLAETKLELKKLHTRVEEVKKEIKEESTSLIKLLKMQNGILQKMEITSNASPSTTEEWYIQVGKLMLNFKKHWDTLTLYTDKTALFGKAEMSAKEFMNNWTQIKAKKAHHDSLQEEMEENEKRMKDVEKEMKVLDEELSAAIFDDINDLDWAEEESELAMLASLMENPTNVLGVTPKNRKEKEEGSSSGSYPRPPLNFAAAVVSSGSVPDSDEKYTSESDGKNARRK